MRQPRSEKQYTWHVVLENATNQATKVVRIPGHLDSFEGLHSKTSDARTIQVNAIDAISAIVKAQNIMR